MGLALLKEVEEVYARPRVQLTLVSPARPTPNPKARATAVEANVARYERDLRDWWVDIRDASEIVIGGTDRLALIELRVVTVAFLRLWTDGAGEFFDQINGKIAEVGVLDAEVRRTRREGWKLIVALNKRVVGALRRSLIAHDAFAELVSGKILNRVDDRLREFAEPAADIATIFDDIASRYPVVTSYLAR